MYRNTSFEFRIGQLNPPISIHKCNQLHVYRYKTVWSQTYSKMPGFTLNWSQLGRSSWNPHFKIIHVFYNIWLIKVLKYGLFWCVLNVWSAFKYGSLSFSWCFCQQIFSRIPILSWWTSVRIVWVKNAVLFFKYVRKKEKLIWQFFIATKKIQNNWQNMALCLLIRYK